MNQRMRFSKRACHTHRRPWAGQGAVTTADIKKKFTDMGSTEEGKDPYIPR
jgi:hypothetical protein